MARAGGVWYESSVELVLQALHPWSPQTHTIFARRARRRAEATIGVAFVLERRRGVAAAGGLSCVFVEHVLPFAIGRDAADAEYSDDRAALRDILEGRLEEDAAKV